MLPITGITGEGKELNVRILHNRERLKAETAAAGK
jgi:hypothetical protein